MKCKTCWWADHVYKMGEPGNMYQILVVHTLGTCSFENMERRWDNIIKDLKEITVGSVNGEKMDFAQDHDIQCGIWSSFFISFHFISLLHSSRSIYRLRNESTDHGHRMCQI
jgi:hypothetical protein